MSVLPQSIYPAAGPVVIPVVHLKSVEHGIEQARVAFAAGARGVFLIDHNADRFLPLNAAKGVYDDCIARGQPAPWIGVNLLGSSPRAAMQRVRLHAAQHVSALWIDESGLSNPGGIQVERKAYESAEPSRPSPLLFAGCHFKYQPRPFDLETEAEAMVTMGVDVLTTSGRATGEPCDPEQVRRIRKVIGARGKIAVASGVSQARARELVEAGADVLMASTHISRGFHDLNPDKIRALIEHVTPVPPAVKAVAVKKKGARP
jgi:hypothetical protein